MQEKVLMKGNEAIAEAAILARVPPLSGLSHHAADRGRGLYGEENAEDRRDVFAGRERDRGHQHGLRRGRDGQAGDDLVLQPRYRAQVRGHFVSGGRRSARSHCQCAARRPGLGGIQPSQSDYFLATRGPGHGDFHVLVLAPASVQEMADLTGKAFDLAEKYRMPAMLLADGTMGQMMEPVQLPEPRDPDTIEKDWAVTGTKCQRKHHIVNSLYLSPAELERLNIERFARYAEIEKNECMWEEFMMEDAEVCIVSCGITARVSRNAIVEARKQGIKAGMIRPITLWPFPKAPLRKAADQVKRFVCVELNMGQMREDVQLAVECKKPVDLCFRVGGMIPSPDEVLDAIRKANEGGND